MGMDVFGNEPTASEGKYFRRNVWYWHPLADLCLQLAPEESSPCEHWHSNDGDGLNAAQSLRLAQRLEQLVRDGTVARYIEERNKWVASLPDEKCPRCAGSGIAKDGQSCRQCDGAGMMPSFDKWYKLEAVDVTEFATFLKACGGFSIC